MPRPASLRTLRLGAQSTQAGPHNQRHPPHEAAEILFPDLEFLDDVEIPLRGDPLEIVKQPATATYHRQQASPAGEVFAVFLEMVGELRDPARQEGDLDLRRTRVGVCAPMGTDQLLLAFFR